MKKIIVLVLLSCCTFLSADEKVVIERKPDSEIQSIVVEKDILTIKSKGKTYTFKFSELLKDKSVQSKITKIQKKTPKNLEEAFKYNGEWCFFKVSKTNNRLKCIKEFKYDVFYDGELFKKVLYNGKYYTRSLDKKIYEPHWETKKDFSLHFIPAKQYIEYLANNIELLKKAVKKLELKIPEAQNTVKADREKLILFLKNNSLITVTEPDGKVTTQHSSGGVPSSKLNRQLRIYHRNIKKQEKKLKQTTQYLRNLKYKLYKALQFKSKTEALYKQYVIAER